MAEEKYLFYYRGKLKMFTKEHEEYVSNFAFDMQYRFLYKIPEMNPTDVSIFTVLYNYNRNTENCYIGQKYLSEELNLGICTVIRSLKKLERIGLIKINHRSGMTNTYEANYEKVEENKN